MRLFIAQATDVGRVRAGNEDSVLCLNEPVPGSGQLIVVADGMGGAEAGEVASRMAVETVAEVFQATRRPPREGLLEALAEANARIFRTSCEREDCNGMGTTCTALAARDDRIYIAYAGDSRAYRIRRGGVCRLTQDHSVWAERVREGDLGASPSSTGGRNELTRALGVDAEIDVEFVESDLQPGDRLVVCSDGLWGVITDPEILELAQAAPPQQACTRLVALANSRGGRDNITVVVAEAHA